MKITGCLLIACLSVMSCNKPLPDYSGAPFNYLDTGIDDISVPANGNVFITSRVMLLSGNPGNQPISVTFKGMPSNVYLKYDSLTFRANYNIADSLGARNAVQGVYPMQAIFSNAATGTQTHNFNLTVTAPIDRVALVCGGYEPSNTCGEYEYLSCAIDSVAPGKIMFVDRLSLNNISVIYDTSYGTVDCCTNTFVIPLQNVRGGTLSGSGSFNGQAAPYSEVTMSRIFTTDTAAYTCIVTLSQD